MASRERVVLIGGGLTTARAAESLREAGFDGEVVVLAEERRLPYERPPLSKGYLNGVDPASVVYPHDAAWYRDHDVDVRRGVRATSIEPAEHTVSTNGPDAAGQPLRYDRLLIATGSSPRRFDGPGAGLRGVHTLRRLPDSTRLRTAFRAGDRRVVVIGGGWIGLEAAAAAREYGNEVTVLVRGEVPLASAIGPELGAVFQRIHEEHGVAVRTGTAVSALTGEQGRVAGVVLGTGEEVPADLVLFGIGATPNVELAASAGLTVDDGIVTDAAFRTSADDVYAAGDVANSFNPAPRALAAHRALGERPERRRRSRVARSRARRSRTTTSRTSSPTSTTSAWSTRATASWPRAPSSSCAATSPPASSSPSGSPTDAWSPA